jgi:hypothetical protein
MPKPTVRIRRETTKIDRIFGRLAARERLARPVIGMEAEFNVYLDGTEIIPQNYWHHPRAFITGPLLRRTSNSSQLPTGGAIYFDRGVIEVVTPVIEIDDLSTARMVRNLWEQIGYVRGQLTAWGARSGHDVRLKAYSAHYNVSFERTRPGRRIGPLALLLAYLLPVPVALVGTNRRSTGVGVRPRKNRVEVTVDFTPDPGLMLATAALIVGIVRQTIGWESYAVSEIARRRLPVVAGVVPGKHTTRRGWLTKDYHYPVSPYTADVDEPIWRLADGRIASLRQIGLDIAWAFRRSIRKHSDPFSFRLLFAVLSGRARSLLDLPDRPVAYEDVGRLCRWGGVIEELRDPSHTPFPDHHLSRSKYEQVFLKLVSGSLLGYRGRKYKPVGMKGWYHAIVRDQESGRDRLISLDQLVPLLSDWG